MPVKSYSIKFGTRTEHWVNVLLFDTKRAMRCHLTKRGHKDSSHTNAACWQANNSGKDNCIAELVFARDTINVSTVVHECIHAAHHRAIVLGVPLKDEEFQEWVANSGGNLSDALLAWLDKSKVKVPMECVPARRFITVRK